MSTNPNQERPRLMQSQAPVRAPNGTHKNNAEAMAARRSRLKAQGLCIVCAANPATPGPRGGIVYCDTCREVHSASNARRRERQAAAGIITKATPRKRAPRPITSTPVRLDHTPAPVAQPASTVPGLRERLRMARMRERGELPEVES